MNFNGEIFEFWKFFELKVTKKDFSWNSIKKRHMFGNGNVCLV